MGYCVVFVAGILCTYIFNFFYFSVWESNFDTSEIMTLALYKALPDLLSSAGFVCAMYLLYLLYKIYTKKKTVQAAEKIINSAHIEAGNLLGNATKVAKRIKIDALAMKDEIAVERQQIETLRQNLEEEFQRKKQRYQEEIDGLKENRDRLTKRLKKATKSGNDKLREQGQEGAAKRNEKKLEKDIDS